MLTISEISKITKGRCLQFGRMSQVNGISIDSRTIQKGNVYVAIQGNRLNGHDFITAARRKGAVAVVVSQKVACPDDLAVVLVKDTTRALGRIAAWHRRQFDIPVIAVTGSTGKTTTKEMIAAVLGKRYNVLKNIKTENNQFGVPLTLLRLNPLHEIAVLELGTNQPGDIRWLSQITWPTMVVFTNIGDSHLAGLKNRRGVFAEKIQLIKYLPPSGVVLFNNDDLFLSKLHKYNLRQKIVSFACDADAQYQARNISVVHNRRIDFSVGRHKLTVQSPAMHNVRNALAAISCGRYYKISYNDVRSALAGFQFSSARQEISRVGKYWLIDDTYNANPLSLESAIRTLDAMRIKGRRVVVFGDMLELGVGSKALHQDAGRMIARSDTDIILTTGRHARYTTQAALDTGKNIKAVHCEDLRGVHGWLKRVCTPGDAILVKGSRGMRLERTVAYVRKSFK
jgi:UDP-N-acetylmuramoyl-tripeptide--D-alanyl-D-alanine ligase